MDKARIAQVRRARKTGLAAGWLAGIAALGFAALAVPSPAQAWWHGGYGWGGGWGGGWGHGWGCCGVGVGIGLGFAAPPVYVAPPVYAPPVYVAPPVYAPPVYAPPVAAYPPPTYYYSQPDPSAASAPATNTQVGSTCYAGQYVCPLDHATAAGTNCSCPSETGRVYGRTG